MDLKSGGVLKIIINLKLIEKDSEVEDYRSHLMDLRRDRNISEINLLF